MAAATFGTRCRTLRTVLVVVVVARGGAILLHSSRSQAINQVSSTNTNRTTRNMQFHRPWNKFDPRPNW